MLRSVRVHRASYMVHMCLYARIHTYIGEFFLSLSLPLVKLHTVGHKNRYFLLSYLSIPSIIRLLFFHYFFFSASLCLRHFPHMYHVIHCSRVFCFYCLQAKSSRFCTFIWHRRRNISLIFGNCSYQQP